MALGKLIIAKFQILGLHYKKMGFLRLSSYVIQRIYKSNNQPIKVIFPLFAHPFYLRNIPSDIQIFTQIFLKEELKVDLEKYPNIIIDGGANIGLATLYLKNRYPLATIFAIEPEQSNFTMLLKNTRPYKNIVCYKNGIWNKNARLKIINEDAGNESFVVAEMVENEHAPIVIDAITINEIVKQNNIVNIDLLKLDIEGTERKLFEGGYLNWLSITDNLLIEIHNWIDSEAEATVMNAMNPGFERRMVGEYHFFSKC